MEARKENEMEIYPKDICKGFVQLHIHGISNTSLQGQNIHVYGYTLYSCGDILCVYSKGKFYINMDEGKKGTFKKHRGHIVNSVCDENPDLAVYCKDEYELKGMLQNSVAALSLKRKEIANILYPILENCVSSSYAQVIMDEILDEVVRDVEETADPVNWNDDDVRLACGRVLMGKLEYD